MSVEKPVTIGLIVGLGAASAALAALYVLFKKDEEDFELDPRFDNQATIQRTRYTTICKHVPKEAAGAVIGKGGEIIRQIQKKTNTKINFVGNQPQPDDDSDRVIQIKGSPSDALKAGEMVDDIIDEALSMATERIHIDSSEVGLIIGKNGSTIKAISEESGAKVNVPKASRGSRGGRVPVEIRGTPQQATKALKLIDEKLKWNRFGKNNKPKQQTNGDFRPSVPFTPCICDIDAVIGHQLFEKLETTSDTGCVEIYVSSVQSPSKFWVQPYGSKSTDLDRLLVSMTEFYEKLENRRYAQIRGVKVGDIAAARLEGDEHWFRVRVTNIEKGYNKENKVTVFYLDFGDEATLPESELCALNDDYLFKLPLQAIECSLNGVVSLDTNEWSKEAIDYFIKLTRASLWERVLAKIVKTTQINGGRREHYAVDLIDVKSEMDLDIAQELINKGFARQAIN